MKASQYVKAMAAALKSDPFVDEQAVAAMVKKLSPLSKASGGKIDEAPADTERDGRIIVLNMAHGCTAAIPKLLLVRGGFTLQDAVTAGVMVIKCHDKKWACHQSTRDPADVLCHAAPRRRRR